MEEHVRLRDQLDREAAATGYTALLAAAFFEAVDRRVGEDGAAADVAAFVSDVRSRTNGAAEEIDPLVAERLIRTVYSDESIEDVDAGVVVPTAMLLLAALIADEQFNDGELDDFMAEAVKSADL